MFWTAALLCINKCPTFASFTTIWLWRLCSTLHHFTHGIWKMYYYCNTLHIEITNVWYAYNSSETMVLFSTVAELLYAGCFHSFQLQNVHHFDNDGRVFSKGILYLLRIISYMKYSKHASFRQRSMHFWRPQSSSTLNHITYHILKTRPTLHHIVHDLCETCII